MKMKQQPIEERFNELLFVSNPTEEKGILWRWTKEGKKVLLSFIRSEIAKAHQQGGEEAIEEIKSKVDKYIFVYRGHGIHLDNLSEDMYILPAKILSSLEKGK